MVIFRLVNNVLRGRRNPMLDGIVALSRHNISLYTGNNRNNNITKEYLRFKSEATCTRKVYSENGIITSGSPTFTLFSADVCLTLKLKADDLTGENGLLLSAMTRLKDGSNNFNKNSRVSSLLPVEHINKLFEALTNKTDSQVSLQGSDGSSVDVSFNGDAFSIKLNPSLLPGLNLNISNMPTVKGKQNIEFTGTSNEHALVIHVLREIAASV